MPLPRRIPQKTKPKVEKRLLANRYAVDRKLGSGNFGTAWIVRDEKAKDDRDRLKALKEIPVGELQPHDTTEAVHEANFLRNLQHPGIVKFHDSFIDGTNFCIITEYCENGDLDQKIKEARRKKQQIQETQVIEWFIQLLLALQYMHERKVLHRDLKSRNIFLQNNVIKVGDFGISRILVGTADVANTFVGTPFYMSPEVLKHEGYNSKSDVWSAGCVLYEMCALRHAFDGQTLMDVMYCIVGGGLPQWPSSYSVELKEVFEKLLTKNPATRPSAAQVLTMDFITGKMKLMRSVMIHRHHHAGSAHRESFKLQEDLKKGKTVGELRRESEEQKWKNLPPRERRQRLKRQEAMDDPHVKPVSLKQQGNKKPETKSQEKSSSKEDKEATQSSASDEDFGDTVIERKLSTKTYTVHRTAPGSADQRNDKGGEAQAAGDDKTLTAEDDDYQDLISCLQNALENTVTLSPTVVENTASGAFGPAALQHRIKSLRQEAVNKLGEADFNRAYAFLKDQNHSASQDREILMQGLKKIVKNPDECVIVEQLLFLENQVA